MKLPAGVLFKALEIHKVDTDRKADIFNQKGEVRENMMKLFLDTVPLEEIRKGFVRRTSHEGDRGVS